MSSLAGKTIVYTGPQGKSEEPSPLVFQLEEAGAKVLHLPMINIQANVPGYSQLQADIEYKAFLKWPVLFFTSKNGVLHFDTALPPNGPAELIRSIPTWVVGRATEQVARSLGYTVSSVSTGRNSLTLAEDFLKNPPVNLPAKDYFQLPLFLGVLAGNELQETLGAHYNVCRYDLYQTLPPTPKMRSQFQTNLTQFKPDLLLFTSPSGFQNFAAFGFNKSYPSAAIGRTTAEAMQSGGVQPVIVPNAPEAEAFVQAIIQYFKDYTHK